MIEFLKKLLSDDGKSVPLDCASTSETGLVRAENQDSVLVREDADVYCVADGMGGGDGGAVASALMFRAVDKEVVSSLDLQGRMKAMAAAVHEANAEIQDYALKAGYRQMATTVAMMALRLDDEPTAVIGHVGDSRVYRCRAGKLSALTADHTVAAEINRRSAAAGKDEVVTGRLTHVLTRAVGIGDVEADQDLVGTLAAEVISEAINRAVENAEGAYGGSVYPNIRSEMLFEALGIVPDPEKLRYYTLLDELF